MLALSILKRMGEQLYLPLPLSLEVRRDREMDNVIQPWQRLRGGPDLESGEPLGVKAKSVNPKSWHLRDE